MPVNRRGTTQKKPGRSTVFPFGRRRLFTTVADKNGRGEQVCSAEMTDATGP
jgi:hypothetical protein